MGLNVKKEEVPMWMMFLEEHVYNEGYYFANCEWPDRLNKNCYYLDR